MNPRHDTGLDEGRGYFVEERERLIRRARVERARKARIDPMPGWQAAVIAIAGAAAIIFSHFLRT